MEKVVLFLCGVIMSKLGRVMKQIILLKGKAIHEPCGYELNLVCSFDSKQNKVFIEERIVLTSFVVN